MSDTPRTNKESFFPHDSKYQVCDADFCRQLERELNAANAKIKRLESVENIHSDVLKAIDKWIQQHKAKEDKP